MLYKHYDEEAPTVFFKQAINANGLPEYKAGANYTGLETINSLLMHAGLPSFIESQVNYLINRVEQDQCFIKKITKPMMGFKVFHSTKATIDGIETSHIIRNEQLSEENIPPYKQFMALEG